MASTYLSRTPSTTTNRQKWTISFWIKRSKILANAPVISQGSSSTKSIINFGAGDKLAIVFNSATSGNFRTSMLFSDVSAWYNIIIACDTTQATASNRVITYVNGVQQTYSTETQPSQNYDTEFNTNTILTIGTESDVASTYMDGSMASFYLIDGQQLTPSSFGETDATTGIWKPKSYSGTYGTNGFFLKFENSASLGTDSSGNGNNFTVNGTPTQTVDTPSNNFATINPLDPAPSQTFSNGNLTCSYGATNVSNRSSFAVDTGKWYWEMKVSSIAGGGILTGVTDSTQSLSTWVGNGTYSYGYYSTNGQKYNNASGSAYGSSYTANDIINIAFDTTNGKLYFGKNGTWQNSGNPATDTNPAFTGLTGRLFFPATSGYNGDVINYNFGNGYFGSTAISSPYSDGAGLGKFQYQPPTGYYSLCTKNINVYG